MTSLIFLLLLSLTLLQAAPGTIDLEVTLRDFQGIDQGLVNGGHPDFQTNICALQTGLVDSVLGEDHLPVLVVPPSDENDDCVTIESAESFAQWYTDVEGVNLRFNQMFTFVETEEGSNVWRYHSEDFFPLNGMGYGDQNTDGSGNEKNFHFTLTLKGTFVYEVGQQVVASGDDDFWVFINGKLALDLGGIHAKEDATADLDSLAEELGIVAGERYDFVLFFAERHTVQSVFKIDFPGIVLEQECTAEDLVETSITCENNGYCVYGAEDTDLFGCSCFPGYDGPRCQEVSPVLEECAENNGLSPVTSELTSTVGGQFENDGSITLTVQLPIEDNERDDSQNRATYTLLRFRDQDRCDYPEADLTNWTKVFDAEECTEKYSGNTNLQDLLNCLDTTPVCYNGDDAETEIQCDPVNCDQPPCTRCYPGQILATRGYSKTSLSGNFEALATAENCHYFEICLPWIQQVESSINITKVPEFETNFLVSRVAFSCFESLYDPECQVDPEHEWLIELKHVASYPWYVKEGDSTASLALQGSTSEFELVSIVEEENSGCNQEGEQCVQVLTYKIPGCDSLADLGTYDLLGLEYDCYGDCAEIRDSISTSLEVEASVELQATQDYCGKYLTIDGTDSFGLSMDAYFSDYEEKSLVFIEGDDVLGTIHLLVEGTSDVPITSMQLNELHYIYAGESTEIAYTGDVKCDPDVGNLMCLEIDVADCIPESMVGVDSMYTVTLKVSVIVDYEGQDEKRSIGLGNEFEVVRKIRIIPAKDEQEPVIVETETGSALANIASFMALVVAFL